MIDSSQLVRYEALRSESYTAVTDAYVGIGAPFAHPVRMLKVYNTTDADITISFNGSVAHEYCPAHTNWVNDYASNRIGPVDKLQQPAGDRFYVLASGTLPTVGNIVVVVVYASSY